MFSVRSRSYFLILLLVMLISSLQTNTAQESAAGTLRLLSFDVSYGGKTYDSATNQTTFTYLVSGAEQRPDLSHFDIGIPSCTPTLFIAGTVPAEAVSYGVDPTTGVNGIKWDLPLKTTESRTYSITFIGNVVQGPVQVAVKADSFEIGTLPGPSCTTASLNIDKLISTDGVTWMDASDAPGTQVDPGAQVSFRIIVTNIGNVELTNLTVTDSMYATDHCTVPVALPVAASFDCIVGPFPVEEGQHVNTAIATAVFNGEILSVTDDAYYFSGNLPQIAIDKLISKNDGGTWKDSVKVKSGRDVLYKFVVTNIGNVALTGFTLTDDSYDASSCTLPDTLDPEASFECIIGPFQTGNTDHTNTATVTATYEEQTIAATDTASYQVGTEEDDDSVVIIVIEGPVETINVNIITIFGINIEIDPNDPILGTIHIGDIIRIEGNLTGTGDTVVIVAITVIIINVDIIITGPPSGPIYVPHGCKITGIGNGNPHLKCSKKSKKS